MGCVISTKLKREDYQRLKKACIKSECTRYRFVQKAVKEKLRDFYDRKLSMNEALTTEEKRFMQELDVIKTKILSYVENRVGDMRCPNCGKPWVEHDLETIIVFVKDAARVRLSPCKDCGKPLVEHDFDTILWAFAREVLH